MATTRWGLVRISVKNYFNLGKFGQAVVTSYSLNKDSFNNELRRTDGAAIFTEFTNNVSSVLVLFVL
jgi:hypothetical protein